MKIKGKLKQLSSSTLGNYRMVKYDFIEIGDYTIKGAVLKNSLSDRLRNEIGKEVEISIIKLVIQKQIVAIKTSNGIVYQSERYRKYYKGLKGYIILGLIASPFLYFISGFLSVILVLITGKAQSIWFLTPVLMILFAVWIKKHYTALGKVTKTSKVI